MSDIWINSDFDDQFKDSSKGNFLGDTNFVLNCFILSGLGGIALVHHFDVVIHIHMRYMARLGF